jgi:hypothetical protein
MGETIHNALGDRIGNLPLPYLSLGDVESNHFSYIQYIHQQGSEQFDVVIRDPLKVWTKEILMC